MLRFIFQAWYLVHQIPNSVVICLKIAHWLFRGCSQRKVCINYDHIMVALCLVARVHYAKTVYILWTNLYKILNWACTTVSPVFSSLVFSSLVDIFRTAKRILLRLCVCHCCLLFLVLYCRKNSENFNFKLIIQNTNVIGPSTIVIFKKFFNVKVIINRQ